ncbi:hypothetical protein QBC39DRAFT_356527 [Podospora conica]|nr:hypothetical protein QBC39DRAFT_356527 [Schizothecium conicum]
MSCRGRHANSIANPTPNPSSHCPSAHSAVFQRTWPLAIPERPCSNPDPIRKSKPNPLRRIYALLTFRRKMTLCLPSLQNHLPQLCRVRGRPHQLWRRSAPGPAADVSTLDSATPTPRIVPGASEAGGARIRACAVGEHLARMMIRRFEDRASGVRYWLRRDVDGCGGGDGGVRGQGGAHVVYVWVVVAAVEPGRVVQNAFIHLGLGLVSRRQSLCSWFGEGFERSGGGGGEAVGW